MRLVSAKRWSEEQLFQLHLAKEEGLFDGEVSGIVNHCFNPDIYSAEQMRYLRKGLKAKLDVSFYASPKITPEQMNVMFKALRDGLEIVWFNKPDIFDYKQMQEIYLGLRDGLDVWEYARPEFTWRQMHWVRLGMKDDNVDWRQYCIPRVYDEGQMRWMYEGLKREIAVGYYANPYQFDFRMMHLMYLCLTKELDDFYLAVETISNTPNLYWALRCIVAGIPLPDPEKINNMSGHQVGTTFRGLLEAVSNLPD